MSGCSSNTCAKCGQQQCVCCDPSVLNQPRIISPTVSGGTFTGPAINGPTIDSGTLTGSTINGATIDCATVACTQPPGTCDSSIATTDFVCIAIDAAISSSNADFCTAVGACVGSDVTTCSTVLTCINTNPGSINNPAAFDPLVFATTTTIGVARIATLAEVDGASCGLIMDPCTLSAFLVAGGPSALWTAFENAVLGILGGPGVCAAVAGCGFAPLASPVFTGIPEAPTAAPGTNTTQLATTAFVEAAVIAAAVSCAAVVAEFPAGAATPAGATTFLSSACLGYTSAEIFAAGATCTAISALFPPAGAPPLAGVRFLASSCLSYTAAEILAGVVSPLIANGSATFNTSGVPATDGTFTASVFDTGGLIANNAGNARFTFTSAQANTEYSVQLSRVGTNINYLPHTLTKATTHFDFNVSDLGAAVLAVTVDVSVFR